MKRKKTMILAGLAAVLASSALAFGPDQAEAKTSADFTDLKDLDAATKAKFDAMISAGIFDGVSDGTFGLKDEMNRAQFAKVAALIYGLDVNKDAKTSSFSDVKADDAANGYALPYIEAIKKAGITDGMGDGRFNPAGDVTKEQLATFLVRGLGKNDEAKEEQGVKDDTVSEWAKGYVALALELKLLSNGSDGKFGGNSNATRDLLVLGAYEAKEQFIPPGSVKPSASPTPTATPTPTPTATPYYPPVSTQTPTATPTATPTPTVAPIENYVLKMGSESNSVAIEASSQPNNSLLIKRSSTAISTPIVGYNAFENEVGSDYESGDVIVDVPLPYHIGLYEVTSNGVVVKFSNIALTAPADIDDSAYDIESIYEENKIKLTLNSVPTGATKWQFKMSGSMIGTPPAGAVFGGNDLVAGINVIELEVGKNFLAIAAVDDDGKVVSYKCVDINEESGTEQPNPTDPVEPDPNNPVESYPPVNPPVIPFPPVYIP
ncbi:S-layer homology domain-containing protein [Paenibacillus sp. PAMC21692]|uniref:S-layer homology domain-containing protein n=1 Tax=Paenibacillus sp. PAMC21692 TaxID=2762320 RepID=UPI00164D12B0|nr:S-layer homology domain-containing protein [Paenibacillus sp. PAMC21692]QNK56874.1 S-layer homology domain-containing protein [Paenibacillus sp. PAMC21692]